MASEDCGDIWGSGGEIMAGSYSHCTKNDGSFCFNGMIENMRDAAEACEEMHWLIGFLSDGDPNRIGQALAAYVKQTRREGSGWIKSDWKEFDAERIRNYGKS